MNTSCIHRQKISGYEIAFKDTRAIQVYKNLDSNFLHANPYCIEFLGLKKSSEVIGKNDYDFFWCEYAHLYKSEENKVITEESYVSLVPSINRNGDEILFFSTRELVYGDNHFPIGILCQARPIMRKEILELSNLLDRNIFSNKKHVFTCNKNENLSINLTKCERECLFFLLRGYSAKMIANTFFRTVNSVEAHIEKIKNKFNVSSKFELIAKAIQKGYLYDMPKTLLSKLLSIKEF